MADFTGPGRGPTLPAAVRVAFPARVRLGIGCGVPTRYEVEVAPAEVLGSGFDFRSHPGHKRFRSSAPAVFDDPEDAAPANAAELLSLARRVAYDYYRWRLVRRDVSYPGTVAYEPDGTADLVSWTYRPDEVATRVTTPPYDAEPEDLLHGLACDSHSGADDERCDRPRRPDEDRNDRFLWVWFDGEVKGARRQGRTIVPGGASVEVMTEGESGVLCPTGVFRDVWHYMDADIPGEKLGIAKCWRDRLVTFWWDNEPSSSTSDLGSSSCPEGAVYIRPARRVGDELILPWRNRCTGSEGEDAIPLCCEESSESQSESQSEPEPSSEPPSQSEPSSEPSSSGSGSDPDDSEPDSGSSSSSSSSGSESSQPEYGPCGLCEGVPRQIEVTFAGIGNTVDCLSCSGLNGTWVLDRDMGSAFCRYTYSGPGIELFYDEGLDVWFLTIVGVCGDATFVATPEQFMAWPDCCIGSASFEPHNTFECDISGASATAFPVAESPCDAP